jgi:methionyl-tRNA synthetase
MQYRKKPVVIDAELFTYPPTPEFKEFVGDHLGIIQKSGHIGSKAEAQIYTLEDGRIMKVAHIATEGDYVIKGVEGEFYACKPEIFHKTYEAI